MAEKRSVPEIRFKGFTDPWEQRKLGEVAGFAKGFGFSKDDFSDGGKPLFHYGRLYTNYECIVRSVDTCAAPKEGVVLSVGDEVVTPSSGETAEDIAIASAVVSPGIMLGGGLNIVRPRSSLDSVFLALSISGGPQHRDLAKRAQGKSVVHLYNADLAESHLSMPQAAEQRQIGAFFERLDTLITLHQRKYDKLCTLKKAMLDKMFPKPGEAEPEIRFKGFADPWEQRKLGDIAEIVGGGTPDTSNPDYWDGDIDWYSPAELGSQIYVRASQRRITELGYNNCSAKMLPADKTILFTSRAGIGNTAILRRSACTNQGFQSLVVRNDADVYFLYSMSGRVKRWAEEKASGSTFLEISGRQLSAMSLLLPSVEEQRQIGAFFERLDSLITLHQRKLELLKNVKKSMLDKMFV